MKSKERTSNTTGRFFGEFCAKKQFGKSQVGFLGDEKFSKLMQIKLSLFLSFNIFTAVHKWNDEIFVDEYIDFLFGLALGPG